MLTPLLDGFVILAIIAMLFSPAVFFKAVDKYLFREHDENILGRDIFNETLDIDSSCGENIFNREDTIARDERVMENLQMMADRYPEMEEGVSVDLGRLWAYKKLEFERKLHWLATKSYTNGHETLPVT